VSLGPLRGVDTVGDARVMAVQAPDTGTAADDRALGSSVPERRRVSPVELYAHGLLGGDDVVARERDGTIRRLPLEDWMATRLPGDDGLLEHCKGTVLDVGCGPGRLTVAVGATGLSALGLDVSRAALALAKDRGRNGPAPLGVPKAARRRLLGQRAAGGRQRRHRRRSAQAAHPHPAAAER
jgi:SAM-dependent methyltransferase